MVNKFDSIRKFIMEATKENLESINQEVLITGSQEYCTPIVGDDGDEGYLVITFKIPKGSRDGDIYDGYDEAKAYEDKCKEKAVKKAEAEKKKAEKIEKDKKLREAKAQAKEKREKEE